MPNHTSCLPPHQQCFAHVHTSHAHRHTLDTTLCSPDSSGCRCNAAVAAQQSNAPRGIAAARGCHAQPPPAHCTEHTQIPCPAAPCCQHPPCCQMRLGVVIYSDSDSDRAAPIMTNRGAAGAPRGRHHRRRRQPAGRRHAARSASPTMRGDTHARGPRPALHDPPINCDASSPSRARTHANGQDTAPRTNCQAVCQQPRMEACHGVSQCFGTHTSLCFSIASVAHPGNALAHRPLPAGRPQHSQLHVQQLATRCQPALLTDGNDTHKHAFKSAGMKQ